MRRFFPCLSALIAAAALLGGLACTDKHEADGLYVFDGATRTILVWASPEKLLAAGREGKPAPKPDRTLKSSALAGVTLAMGGMTLDTNRKRLYLVTEGGTVWVVLHPSTRQGELKGKDDIISFKLKSTGDTAQAGEPVFGQASVDPATDVLYLVENGRDTARVWHVPNVSRLADGATVESRGNTSRTGDDRHGIGVAAGSNHQFYALFGAGDATNDGFGNGTNGPRLRLGEHKGGHPAFMARAGNRDHRLLAGDATLLDRSRRYGSLAYSRSHHCVYVLAGPQAEKQPPGILVFNDNQFHGALDQAPARKLEKVPDGLRIIAHSSRADWLAGAGTDRAKTPDQDLDKDKDKDKDRDPATAPDKDRDPGDPDPARDREHRPRTPRTRNAGGPSLYLWNSPSETGEPVKLSPLAPGIAIRGLAFGGD